MDNNYEADLLEYALLITLVILLFMAMASMLFPRVFDTFNVVLKGVQ